MEEPDDEGIRQRRQPTPRPPEPQPLPPDVVSIPTRGGRVLGVARTSRKSTREIDNPHFPPWAGPVVGPLVLGFLFGWISYQNEGRVSAALALGGAAGGLALGAVIWLCDHPSGRGGTLDVADQGTFVGRFVAILSAVLFWAPLVGLLLSGYAVYANWGRGVGWPRLVSRVALALAAALTATVLGMMALAGALQ